MSSVGGLIRGLEKNLFAVVEKWRDGRQVTFEGSYGFGLDAVTHGWLKLSHRALAIKNLMTELHARDIVLARP